MRQRHWASAILGGVLAVGCNKQADPPATNTKPTAPTTSVPTTTAPAYDLASLTKDLKSTSPQRRETAIRSALELDENETDVVPTLLDALKDNTASTVPGDTSDRPTSTRETAVLALLKLGSKGKKALADKGLKTLVEGLKDAKPTVREHTVNALGMVGPEAKPVIEAVAERCADADGHVRSAAYRALQKIKNPPGVPLAKLLLHAEPAIAMDAAAALTWVKPTGPEVAPVLIDALKREPSEKIKPEDVAYIRNAAADAIAASGKQAEGAIPALVELLTKTPADQVERLFRPTKPGQQRSFSSGPVSALRKIGKPALPAVLPLLKHEEAIVRYQATLIIGGMGQDADTAKEGVLAALELERGLPTGQLLVFEELALAALDLGVEPTKITEHVAKLLRDDMVEVRYRATFMIARLGRAASSAVDKLTELLNDLEPQMQVATLEALAAIGPASKMALPEVIKKVEGDDNNIARAGTKVLKALGPEAMPAVPALIKGLNANDPSYCIEVVQTLGQVGPLAVEAVPALSKMLDAESTRPEERLEIMQTLALIGPMAKGAIPSLLKYTTAKEFPVRAASAQALGKLGAGNADVQKKLVEMLKDGQAVVRIAALKALATQGPAAKGMAPDIKAMADKTTSVDIKIWSAATLVALGSDVDNQLKTVTDALKNKKPEGRLARGAALDAVGYLGAKAKGCMPDVVEALKDKTPLGKGERVSLRERAAKAVVLVGEPAKEATPALVELLRETDANLRTATIDALGAIGPAAVLAVPKLKELARSDNTYAERINNALDRITPPKKLD